MIVVLSVEILGRIVSDQDNEQRAAVEMGRAMSGRLERAIDWRVGSCL